MKRSHGARAWLLLAAIVLALAGSGFATPSLAQSLEIIDLHNRTAQEVIPVLQPILEPGGALSGQDYKLFVRASAANVAQLRAVLAQIDRPSRQLLVSVRVGSSQEIERDQAAVSGTVRTGDASVSVNEPPRSSSGVAVQATSAASRSNGEGISSVQVMEGNSAFIATGTDVPVVTAIAGGVGRRSWVAGATEYRGLSSGFVVTPRVNGGQVVLAIEQHSDNLRGGAIETQQLTTQVAGALGRWILLGGVNESEATGGSTILGRQYATRSDARTIWVKVEAR
jgi:type II secretory pathway component GspD/PulD (secretin)